MRHTVPGIGAASPFQALSNPDYVQAADSSLGITVRDLAANDQAQFEEPGREIIVLVPCGKKGVRVTCEAPAGSPTNIFVRDPYVAVIPAGRPCTIHCEAQARGIVVGISQSSYERHTCEASIAGYSGSVRCICGADLFLREMGGLIRSSLGVHSHPSHDYSNALAIVIATHLAHNYTPARMAANACSGLPARKLELVCDFIDAHLNDQMTVKQLAGLANLSTFHFSRMFRQSTGSAPHFYMTLRRMEKAKNLLRAGTLPLTDVAASVGFQTQSHFSTVFLRYAGMTPRAFRRSEALADATALGDTSNPCVATSNQAWRPAAAMET